MIEQLPMINLLLLLGTALIIPLFKKRKFSVTLITGFLVMLVVWIFSVFLLVHVHGEGTFYYALGMHDSRVGLEFRIDVFAVLFTLFVLTLAMLIYVYSCGDATEGIHEKEYGRYYILLFILLFSMFGIIYTNDLFNTYVFMEILSITTCSIISIKRKKDNYSAAFRYVMLNEIGSLSYLFGVALLYMITGYTNIELVSEGLQATWTAYPANVVTAIGFMVVGIGLKAAIFPFHIWLPDAHSTAPTSSSAILSAIVVKVYILILVKVLFRVFGVDIITTLNIPLVLSGLAALGMVMGSVFALAQNDIKRMLGYSSVAQIGYIIMAISLMSAAGLTAAFFHIVSHGIMKTVLFLSVGAVIYLKRVRKVHAYGGMGYVAPITMFIFGIAALGMIGIPATSGFIAKLNLGVAALEGGRGLFIGIIIVSGVLNALYYLPILISAFFKVEKTTPPMMRVEKLPATMLVPMVILGLAILVIGFFPNTLLTLIESAVANFAL